MRSLLKSTSVLAVAGLLAAISAQAGLVFTIEGPGVQQTTVAGATTETFDSLPLGLMGTYHSSAIGGTYVGGQVAAASQYGGAGGNTRFDVVGLGNTTVQTLTFDTPQAYFGMWWSAGDPSNELKFYRADSTLLASYVIGDILPSLSSAYYGNPNPAFLGQDATEAFVYLNFTSTDLGSLIGSVEFDNVTTSGFESDNHSVYGQLITPPGQELPDAAASLPLMGGAIAILMFLRRMVR